MSSDLSETPISRETTPPTGDHLKAVREAKGLSRKDVYTATRIASSVLEGMEEERYELLPEPVYAKTFIRSYAKYLGVDSRPLLARYDAYLTSLAGTAPPKEDIRPEECIKESATTASSPYRRLLPAGGILLAAFLVAYVLVSDRTEEVPSRVSVPDSAAKIVPPSLAPTLPGETSPRAKTAENTSSAHPSSPPSALSPVSSPASSNYRLVMEATDKTWIRVQEDGGAPQERLLQQGDVVTFTAKQGFQLDVGNAAGVQISFQGRPLGPLGAKGEVIHLSFP